MLNFIPKRCPSVSLLYGKRPVQRIKVGTSGRVVEVPSEIIDTIHNEVDTQTEYVRGSFNALPFAEFSSIRLDASALMETEQTTAISSANWFPSLNVLQAGNVASLEEEGARLLSKPSGVKMNEGSEEKKQVARRFQQMDGKLSSLFYAVQHSTIKGQGQNTWGGDSGLLKQFSGMSSTLFAFQSLITKAHAEMNIVPTEKIYFNPQAVPDMLATKASADLDVEMEKLEKEYPEYFSSGYSVEDDSAFLESMKSFDVSLNLLSQKLGKDTKNKKFTETAAFSKSIARKKIITSPQDVTVEVNKISALLYKLRHGVDFHKSTATRPSTDSSAILSTTLMNTAPTGATSSNYVSSNPLFNVQRDGAVKQSSNQKSSFIISINK